MEFGPKRSSLWTSELQLSVETPWAEVGVTHSPEVEDWVVDCWSPVIKWLNDEAESYRERPDSCV